MTFRWLPIIGLIVFIASACGTSPEETSATLAKPAFCLVEFSSSDGIKLSGRLYGPESEDFNACRTRETAVILAHMFPADQTSWHDFAQTLAEQGYSALSFDFRGYSNSDGKKNVSLIDRDLEGALDFTLHSGAKRVFLVGASMGGTASIKVASRREVSAVVTLSAPDEFQGLDAREDIKQVKAPKLFVGGERDRVAEASANFLFARSSDEKEIKIFQTGAHGTDLLEDEPEMGIDEAILGFLARHR